MKPRLVWRFCFNSHFNAAFCSNSHIPLFPIFSRLMEALQQHPLPSAMAPFRSIGQVFLWPSAQTLVCLLHMTRTATSASLYLMTTLTPPAVCAETLTCAPKMTSVHPVGRSWAQMWTLPTVGKLKVTQILNAIMSGAQVWLVLFVAQMKWAFTATPTTVGS